MSSLSLHQTLAKLGYSVKPPVEKKGLMGARSIFKGEQLMFTGDAHRVWQWVKQNHSVRKYQVIHHLTWYHPGEVLYVSTEGTVVGVQSKPYDGNTYEDLLNNQKPFCTLDYAYVEEVETIKDIQEIQSNYYPPM
jgi:hypothetical protein